jgi:hypothetical protein
MTRRRVLFGASLSALAVMLGGCGDHEQASAEALAQYLQTNVIEKPAVSIARPSADDAQAFGRFASDYDALIGQQASIDNSIKGALQKTAQALRFRSVMDLVDRRGEIDAARAGALKSLEEIDLVQRRADELRATLTQPEPLKAIYAAAFEKAVVKRVASRRELYPTMLAACDSALAVAAFVEKNRSDITADGLLVEVRDAAKGADLNRLLSKLATLGAQLHDMQGKLSAPA